MGARIAQAALIIQTLRDAGYKNTSYAVAELVDNSIEANGKNIHISIESGEEQLPSGAVSERIQKIGIFDDGEGMDADVLSKCLSFGWGTRLQNGTGLGKFGFGLKGASISQAKRIEIYSWQNGMTPNFIYLDVDEIIENDSQELPEPENKEIPAAMKHLINGTGSKSGTLIVWTKLDRLNPKRAETLVNHLNGDMCRIFRHYMDDNDQLGEKRNISVGIIDRNGKNIQPDVFLKANDPSYLLTPNNLPGHETEATNEINDSGTVEIKDENGKTQTVEIICTVAKPAIQALGGNSAQGQHYGRNNGISFVRHGRELELSYKGFYTQSEPRNRWIGLEIRFPPALDKYFNVPNNKQSVRDFRNFDEDEKIALKTAIEQDPNGFEGRKAELLLKTCEKVLRFFRNAEGIVKSRGKGSRLVTPPVGGKTEAEKATEALKEKDKTTNTVSQTISAEKTEEQKLKEIIDLLKDSNPELTEDELNKLAHYQLNNVVEILEKGWPGDTFLDIEFKGNAAISIVNSRHKFHEIFYDYLQESEDSKGIEALRLMILAFARTEDVLRESGDLTEEQFEKFRSTWGRYLTELLPLVQ